ncbi:MAG: hypothetical protein QNJ41_19460 [Xenococcaceae cyanobacterium MO_188.B32]|nr:hypothetical protein [Xenococcaceae cyanobacterium MO_188.B32]
MNPAWYLPSNPIAIGIVIFPWSFFFVIPLTIYAVIVIATPSLRQTLFWWRLGKFDLYVWQILIEILF